MDYCFRYKDLFQEYEHTNNIEKSIENYIKNNYKLLDDIYFRPKKIKKHEISNMIQDKDYKTAILKTISNLKNINLDDIFSKYINEFKYILDYNNIHKKVYVIIGFNTTTIYSTKYENEDVTVILLESTLGLNENIKMLLAHEYTHWIREKEINYNIFEKYIGERFVTEGIACNFAEEVLPNKQESFYTIVPDTTVEWVKNNLETIDKIIENELNKNNMMYDFFYMFAKTSISDMPVRTGYVYGYLKVKEYIKSNNLKIKDIIKIDWREIIN